MPWGTSVDETGTDMDETDIQSDNSFAILKL